MRRFVNDIGVLLALALFVMAVASGCGGSASPTTPTPSPGGSQGGSTSTADLTITISGINGSQSFSPSPATVKVGQKVAWRNADALTHTATADGGAFNTGPIAPGATSAAITMTTAGTFGYHCSPHPVMTGSLVVQ